MLKKVLAGLATVALALAAVVVTAGPASAHHNDIVPTISCTDTYSYKVTWSVTNSENLHETITASSDEALVPPLTTVLTSKQTQTFVEYFTAPVTKTLTLSAQWTNGQTNTSSATIKPKDFPPCAPNHVPVTICHATPPATAAQGWQSITVDDDSIVKSGHDGHALDIIPAFTYWENVDSVWTQLSYPGKNLDTVFSGFSGSSILTAGCAMTVSPTAPTFAPALCVGPGVQGQGSYTIPTSAGVEFSVRINGGQWNVVGAGTYPQPIGTVIDVKAAASPGWVTLTGTTSWSYTVPSPGDCIVTVTPVAPDVKTITECGVYGSVVPKATQGVVYQLTAGNGLEGAWTITATPAQGYKFDGAQEVTFSGNLGVYTDCATPTVPTFSDSECTLPGEQSGASYTIPETEGVQYQVKLGDDPWADAETGVYPVTVYPTSISIRAVALDGYTLKDYTGPWNHVFESAGECLQLATPVAPAVVPITECGVYGSVTPKDTTGVAYALTSGNGTSGLYTVTATPKTGYYFADDEDQSIEFSGDLGVYTDCVTPLTPGFTDSECTYQPEPSNQPITLVAEGADAGFFTIPTKAGVQYSVSINGGDFEDYAAGKYPVEDGDSVSVKATALPGYTLTDYEGPWSHTFTTAENCRILASPVEPKVTVITECGVYGSVIPDPAPGVVYELTEGDGKSGPYTLTATPAPGFYFADDEDQRVEYSGDLGTYVDCVTPTLDIEGSFATGVCLADSPWIFYDVTMIDPDNQATGHTARLILTDPNDPSITETIELGDLVETSPGVWSLGGTADDKVLWPGASVDPITGEANGWPGWEQTPEGVWVETTGNFAWTRDITSAVLSVNPELAVALQYPEATPDCVTGPPDPPTLAIVTPIFSTSALTCTAAGSYTLGELSPGTVQWTVNGSPVAVGTYPVTSAQTLTFVAAPLLPEDGLDPDWVQPAPVVFSPGTAPCALVTLASTGGAVSLGLAGVGSLLGLMGVGLMLARRRFGATNQ